MSGKNIIMIILENMYVEITNKWYIDFVVKKKKTIWICRPSAIYGDIIIQRLQVVVK